MNNLVPFDISNNPELIRIVQKVQRANKGLFLKKDKQTIAVVMPVVKEKSDYKRFMSSAGSWSDIDTDTLIKQIYSEREKSNKAPARNI